MLESSVVLAFSSGHWLCYFAWLVTENNYDGRVKVGSLAYCTLAKTHSL